MLYLSSVSGLNKDKAENKPAININNTSTISFSGHKILDNENGEKFYRFYLPNNDASKVEVELVRLFKDRDGNIVKDRVEPIKKQELPKDRNYTDFNLSKDYSRVVSDDFVLGYRFLIDGKPYSDNTLMTKLNNGDSYNVAIDSRRTFLSGPRTMYHVMPANFNPKAVYKDKINILGERYNYNLANVTTNHFNKYDAKLNDLIKKIPEISKMGFKTIISTPIFGQDNISTHGYWTTNPYQITSSLGDMNDYEKLQKELFKRGMGFVADGAFVNEGLEGIHLRDIFKYGKNSPYYNWFEMHGDPNEPITVGVLPMDKKAADNYDIRIVNSPVIWSVNAKGFASEINGFKNTSYNPEKPTYIQLYDRRLTSVDQLERQELIRSYDIKNPKDKNEIKDYMDSVQPYAFEVSPDEVVSKFREPLGENEEFKEHLKNWKNFSLAEASEDKRVTLWVGNKDIAKLKFMITEKKLNDIRKAAPSPEAGERKVKQIKEGINQVQDSIINIGKYWTKKTYDLLTLHTAEILAGAKTVDEYKQKIRENADKLPPQIAYLADENDKTIENLFNGEYNYDNFPKTFEELNDGIKEFPLESIEFSPEVTSILASPDFKKEAEHDIYDSQLADVALEILVELSDSMGVNLVRANQLTEEGKVIFSLISDDIAKYLIVKSLAPTFDQDDHRDVPKLRQITLNSLNISQGSHSQAAEELSMRISKGLQRITEKDLRSYAKDLASTRLKGVKTDSVLVSKLIMDKSQSGLNWRIDASKDIADMEALPVDKANHDEIWGSVIDFWKKFNDGVNEYNKHSYKIGELTDVSVPGTSTRFKTNGDVEEKFVTETGFVTQSNYNYLYSTSPGIVSGFAEKDGDWGSVGKTKALNNDLLGEKLLYAWGGTPGFLFSGPKDNIIYSHVFSGNHDKPRTLHGFAINAQLAYSLDYKHSFEYSSIKEIRDALGDTSEFAKDLRVISEIDKDKNYNLWHSKIEKLFDVVPKDALSMEAALADSFSKSLKTFSGVDERMQMNYKRVFVKAADKLAKMENDGEYFAQRPFEQNWANIMEEIQNSSANSAVKEFFKKNAKALEKQAQGEFLAPAMKRYTEMLKIMTVLPGNPTVYAGDELGETGYETKSKNVYRQNRNRNHWERIDKNNKDYRPYIDSYRQEVSDILKLRQKAGLSPLVDGETILLKQPVVEDNNFRDNVSAIYRYNDKEDVIAVFNNAGFNAKRHFEQFPQKIKEIDLTEGKLNENGDKGGKKDPFMLGLPFKLDDGTEYVNAMNPDDKVQYVIQDGKLVNKDGGDIVVDGSVLLLKRK